MQSSHIPCGFSWMVYTFSPARFATQRMYTALAHPARYKNKHGTQLRLVISDDTGLVLQAACRSENEGHAFARVG